MKIFKYLNESAPKNITIPLEEGILMCLTFKELAKLASLLNEAAAMFEANKILQNI